MTEIRNVNMEIRDLPQISANRVVEAFEAAFSDYAVSFDRQQIESMLKRRGYDPALSFAALDNEADGRIAAFILNGVGEYANETTCYDARPLRVCIIK